MITLPFKVLRLVGNYYVLCSVSSVYLYGWSLVNLNFNSNTLNRGLEFYKDLVQPFQMFAVGRVNISLFEQLVSLVTLVTYIFGLLITIKLHKNIVVLLSLSEGTNDINY